ncbi:restriction endonuclease subunit S [Lactococcus lactis]|nr:MULTISPECIES: restriction endonuclease subunit S [Lactococcus]KSU29718.1 Type I restriction-modification system specificity subunit S [Lactococcus lactis subsp. lactis]MBS4460840.1 restriction endonuclease subunit S [Lactococcus petauri]MCT3109303.1 restriction endonuclease subunit S [Lactococcus lactis]
MAKIDDSVKKKVPELRFPGFTDDWEERKLNENVENIGTGRSSFKAGLDYSEQTPYEVLGSTSVISYSDSFDHSGNFVLTARVGANAGNLYKHSGNVKISDNTVYIQSKNLEFIFYLLTKYDLKKLAFGTGQPLIKASELKNLKLFFPKTFGEQKKIGSYFKQLDETIALHQRKLDLLKEQKKGFLQKMFPKNGAKVPELRFAGFADDWEERKLGEISKTTIGEFVIKTKQSDESPYPVYNGGRSYTGKYDEYNNDGPKIVISARGANAGFVNYVSGRYWAGNSCYSVSVTKEDEFSIGYLYQFIKYNQVLFTAYQQAANIPSVSKSDVEKFSIKYPTVLEQKKIESFFKQLDNTITLHQFKLDLLKEQKKGFLQKMFV